MTRPVSLEEAELIEQVRSGRTDAFESLVRKYQDRVFNTCWRIAGNLEDARDLTQDAFLKAYESISGFRGQASFYTWVFRIAVNLSLSHRRKSGRRNMASLDAVPDGTQVESLAKRLAARESNPDETTHDADRRGRVTAALTALDDDHRAMIVLRDMEGFDYREIAEILELPEGTVKSRLFRARQALRDLLEAGGTASGLIATVETMDRNELFESISAYLDGELGEAEAAEVRRALESDAEARRFYESLKENATQVAALPRHRSPDSILSGIRHQLEREALLETKADAPRRTRRRWFSPRGLSLAASLVIVLAAGVWAGIYFAGGQEKNQLADRKFRRDDDVAARSQTGAEMNDGAARPAESGLMDVSEIDPDTASSGQLYAMMSNADGRDASGLLNVEQKLKIGTSNALLQQHRFENEPMRLQVAVADTDARRKLESRVESLLRTRQVPELSQVKEEQPPPTFYQAGRIGVNYDDTRTEQILVRIPQSQLEELVADLQGDTTAQSVDMRINDLRVQGADQVQMVVAQMGEPAPDERSRRAVTEEQTAVNGGDGANGSLVNGFLEVFRLNQELFRQHAPDEGEDAGTTAPSPAVAEGKPADAESASAGQSQARRRAARVDVGESREDVPTEDSSAAPAPEPKYAAKQEEPSLVKRRLEAAQARKDADGIDVDERGPQREGPAASSYHADFSMTRHDPSETLVTLVLELVVQNPTSNGAPTGTDGTKPSPRPASGKPASENGRNSNASSRH